MSTLERYIVQRNRIEYFLRGIPLRSYSWLQNFKAVETFRIDLDQEIVMYDNDLLGGGIAFGGEKDCNCECDFDEDHHDMYPLTVALIRAAGVSVTTYYMTRLWQVLSRRSRIREYALFEKQLLRVIVGFL